MSLMVSISGIRGIVGESLTPDVIVKYSSAFAEYRKNGPIVIGRDGRTTGKMIGNLISSTLISMGRDVVALGVVPTPTVAFAVSKMKAAGGIAVTASHNPVQWNGMKFISDTGMFLNADENKELCNIANDKKFRYVSWEKIGNHRTDETYIDRHIETILGLPFIYVERIKKCKFKVVVDCVNSAGGMIVPKLLRKLGCTVIGVNCDATGVFKRNPEPVPENLGELCGKVVEENAHFGIAVDPDADRLVFITEKGEPFGEEYTVTSAVKFILETESRKKPVNPLSVVVNLSTSRAVDDVARSYGAAVYRTPVGEINVARKMKDTGAVIGGEGSGGVILPMIHYSRDAAVGIALILQQLADFTGTISEFRLALPQYSIIKSKIDIGSRDPDRILDIIRVECATDGKFNNDDGLKIDFHNSWVHLRKSNTEPIIRIIAEADSQRNAESLAGRFVKKIERQS